MAAPMLAASCTPRSVICPNRTSRTATPPDAPAGRSPERISAPAAVAVHCAVGVRWPPYSSGRRNWRSAEQKWEDVTASARRAAPASTNTAAMASVCAMVEHAPYCPRKGISSPRRPNTEAAHWLSRSPANTQSISSGCSFALRSARCAASFRRRLSAFSQLCWPSESSVWH